MPSALSPQPSTAVPRYVIITPARNEGQYLQKTIDSVVAQTLRPQKWVIVNDGSTDVTPLLIDVAAKQHSWINAVHRADRGFRKAGGGVIEAFYDGFNSLNGESWDYVVKLDGDLSFEAGYFERCFARFSADPKLGVAGGTICKAVSGALEEEAQGDPPFHVRGATKIYRRACWDAIGGLIKAPGWDTLDEVKANMLGWSSYTFKELKVHQLKPTGKTDGAWKNWVKNGRANYVSGYHPLFMFCKCAKRLTQKPVGTAALGLLAGFLSGYFRRVPQVADKDLIRFLRQQQLRRLTLRSSLWAARST